MNIAFVGVKRKYKELDAEYIDFFTQYHLELPYYYASIGNNVTVSTVDYSSDLKNVGNGTIRFCEEKDLKENHNFDVIVHWRKWFDDLYCDSGINVINCQDHSFSSEWNNSAQNAFLNKKLFGILCFPTWHKRNLLTECSWLQFDRAIDGLTLGVDTDIYKPSDNKDPYHLLWASDPGRGLFGAVELIDKLFRKDKRYRLHVCYPDYCKNVQKIHHPAIIWEGNVQNGQRLWNLFNSCGVLPYTSTFKEPSSRAHRQAQAAGSLVLYPPNMGSPSELILNASTGVIADVGMWADKIGNLVSSGEWKNIGMNARNFAESENWQVQAKRFTTFFTEIK